MTIKAMLGEIASDCENHPAYLGTGMSPEQLDDEGGDAAFITGLAYRLRAAITQAEQAGDDTARLDWLEDEADDLRTVATGDDDYDWVVVSHHMDKPHEREIGRGKTTRAAIDSARGAGEV